MPKGTKRDFTGLALPVNMPQTMPKGTKRDFTGLALPVNMPQAMPKGTKRVFTLAEPTDRVTQSIGIQI
mgnify:CR=1 FL=1